jgi:polyisoprenyl-phosphate glycosyltransferase
MSSQLTVSVVIPVYRAEQTLLDLYRQISAAMSEITRVFEIIFVEDGSGDGSWPIIAGLGTYGSPGARHPHEP